MIENKIKCDMCDEVVKPYNYTDYCKGCWNEQTCEECGITQNETNILEENNRGSIMCIECIYDQCKFCGERVDEGDGFCGNSCWNGYASETFRD